MKAVACFVASSETWAEAKGGRPWPHGTLALSQHIILGMEDPIAVQFSVARHVPGDDTRTVVEQQNSRYDKQLSLRTVIILAFNDIQILNVNEPFLILLKTYAYFLSVVGVESKTLKTVWEWADGERGPAIMHSHTDI